LLAGASKDNWRSANGSNQARIINVFGVLHDRLQAWALNIPMVGGVTGQD
jgi:hypothetical protein